MALREIRKIGDEILRKKSRKVEGIDEKIRTLLDDMVETMHHENGLGLAAPQVGVLKRIVVVDAGEKGILKLINPEYITTEGSQESEEGCLSIPNVRGVVERPEKVVIRALNEDGEEIIVTGEELMATAFCHEMDHLDGTLFVDKMKKEVK